ncbi:hypothetical protein J6590_035868 [Homalodisca vitripennis]|nr:hypothetical protein J6590_035868 [Homalodisca vitripennis]
MLAHAHICSRSLFSLQLLLSAFETLSSLILDVFKTVNTLKPGLGTCCWGPVRVTGGAVCCDHVVNLRVERRYPMSLRSWSCRPWLQVHAFSYSNLVVGSGYLLSDGPFCEPPLASSTYRHLCLPGRR